MKFIRNKKILFLFVSMLLVSVFSKIVFAAWSGTFYEPGDTLNPECMPSETDCDVRAPLTATNISDAVYDATAWNGVTTIAPSKNAIRDKIETLATSLTGVIFSDQSTPQTLGATGARLAKLWATDLTLTNAPTIDSLTPGSIMFVGASNEITEDTVNLVWDNTNKQLQIGTPPTAFAGNSQMALSISNDVDNYTGVYTQNVNGGESASTDYIVGADNDGVALLGHFGDFGIQGSGFDPGANPTLNGLSANDIYLYGSGGNLILGTDAGVAGKIIKFFVGGLTASDQMATLTTTGFGINTTNPGSALDVKGTLRLSGSSSGYVGFAPAAAAGSTTYVLPDSDGTNNYVLTTDGSGNLSWSDKTGGTPGSISSINGNSLAAQTIAAGAGLTISNVTSTHTLFLDQAYAPTWTGAHVFSNATNSALFTGGNVGIGTVAPTGLLSVTPLQYSSGSNTASQNNSTTVVGVGTSFTGAMIGSQIVYADGTSTGPITAVADSTHLTVTTSQTVASQTFKISYTGLQVATNGLVGIGTATPVSALHVATAPTASANYGLLSLGSGSFDGSTSGFFVGSSSGTVLAANAASGFGGNLIDLQVAGSSKFLVTSAGAVTAGTINGLTITANGTNTLTIAAGKTFTSSNTLTLAGTDGSTLNIGTGGTLGTAAYTAAGAYEAPLTFSTGLTRSTNTITNNLSTGVSGGQTAIGGTGSAENLILSSTSNGTKGYVGITNAPRATANYGALSLGSGAFDGSTSGFFGTSSSSSSNGTLIAGNLASGSTSDTLNLQIAGVPKLKQTNAGNLSINTNSATVSNARTLTLNTASGTNSSLGFYQDGAEVNTLQSSSTYFGLDSGGVTRWNIGVSAGNTTFGDGTNVSTAARVDVLGASLTGSAATGVLNLRQTWNTSGAPTALLMNITNTASSASSLLMDLQVGGTSKFKVDNAGTVTSTSSFVSSVTSSFFHATRGGIQFQGDGIISLVNAGVTGFDRLAFGGTSASFPALKRSTTSLEVKLADDSAYTGLTTGHHVPGTSATYDLGTSSNKWRVVYADQFNLKGNSVLSIAESGNSPVYNAQQGGIHMFQSAGSEVARLNSTGFGIGGSPVSKLTIPVAPTASANYGLVSLGSGPFDGTTSNFFVGSSSGTVEAINAASGFAGNLVDWQVAGNSKFKVSGGGITTISGTTTAASYAMGAIVSNTLTASANTQKLYGLVVSPTLSNGAFSTNNFIREMGIDGELWIFPRSGGTSSQLLMPRNGGTNAGVSNGFFGINSSSTTATFGTFNDTGALASTLASITLSNGNFNLLNTAKIDFGGFSTIQSNGNNGLAISGNQILAFSTVGNGNNASAIVESHTNTTDITQTSTATYSYTKFNSTYANASGTPTFKNFWINTSFTPSGASSAVFRPFNIDYTIANAGGAQGGTATGIFLAATETSLNGMTHNLIDLQVGGTSRFKMDSTMTLTLGNAGTGQGIIQFIDDKVKIQRDTDNIFTRTKGGTATGHSNNLGWEFDFNDASTLTSGTKDYMQIRAGFAPTSGTAAYSLINIATTINQTGGANGITRGLYVNPTLTAAADFRGLEIANNANFAIYQSGASADNYFAGDIGIGDATPDFKLDVETDAASAYAASFFNDGGNDNRWGILVQGGADAATATKFIQFNDGDGTDAGSICGTAGVAGICAPSDFRLKSNIIDTELTLDMLLNIKVRDFSYNSDESHHMVHGFVAQELYDIYPDAVFRPTDPNEFWKVNAGQLIPLTIKSIQELNVKITGIREVTDTTFIENLKHWLADNLNGIQKIFTKEVETENLCVADATGAKTCITKAQLDLLLQNGGQSNGGSSSNGPADENGTDEGSGDSSGDEGLSDTGSGDNGTTTGESPDGGDSGNTTGDIPSDPAPDQEPEPSNPPSETPAEVTP